MVRKFLISVGALFLSGLLVLGGCQLVQPDAPQSGSAVQWEQVAEEVPASNTVASAAVEGGQFNRFFPNPEDYERVYTQEKQGFAEAKLKQDGATLAMLSISDTANNPSALTKYQSSQRSLAGYPLAETGSTATSVLVQDRFQVKVLSRDEGFTAADREAWLQEFDLRGLAQLAK